MSEIGNISAVLDPQSAALSKVLPSLHGFWANFLLASPGGMLLARPLLTSDVIKEDGS
jgi:hypothetical protein